MEGIKVKMIPIVMAIEEAIVVFFQLRDIVGGFLNTKTQSPACGWASQRALRFQCRVFALVLFVPSLCPAHAGLCFNTVHCEELEA